jgi:hypothetical protein
LDANGNQYSFKTMAKGGKTKKGDVGKSGTQYGYTLKEYEEMGEKNGLFVSPKEWWSSREGKKYTDSLGRTKTIGSNSQDERQEMQSYGYRIAIGMDLGSDKIPASARKYVIENNLTKEEQKYKLLFSNFKKEKESINNMIMNLMESNNIVDKDIIFGNKKIKYMKSNVQDCITKKLINERLKVFLKNEGLANDATNFIYSDRNSVEKKYLKISDLKND